MPQAKDPARQALLQRGLDLEGDFSGSLIWEEPAKLFRRVSATRVEIGAYSYVAPNSELHGVRIGRYCSLGPNSKLFGSAHPVDWLSSHPFTHKNIFKSFVSCKPSLHFDDYGEDTVIGHDVWTGTNVVILPGVKIGHGAIVGAGAVVAKDVPDYAVVVGNPGRVVKYRFDEKLIERILRVQWWQYDLPRHMETHPDLPFDKPEAMLDYIEAHAGSLPKFSGVRKKLSKVPEGLKIQTIRPAASDAQAAA